MEGQIVELYSDGDLLRLRRRIRIWTGLLCAVAAAALAACIALAALTNTANALKTELAAELTSTLAGWFVIYCGVFVVAAARRELAHAQMLRAEERERAEGAVTVTKERLRIRKSVAVRRVELRREEQVQRFLVAESRADALAKADAGAVYTAHGYIAAYETAGEARP